ncbi:MAG: DUF927 domain-containing protein [Alphaproteobacteria bacterium]|nr:DUF927 domain-containing protein [Alphaproteobacteria bacterium]
MEAVKQFEVIDGEAVKNERKTTVTQQNAAEAEARNIGYILKDSGLYKIPNEDKEPPLVCARLEVLAEARDENKKGWSKLVEFADADGVNKRLLLPNKLQAGDGRELLEVLLDNGLRINNIKLLKKYLNDYQTSRRALIVNRTGWHKSSFIFSNSEILGESEEVIYFDGETAGDCKERGTLEEWRDNIGIYCAGNSRLILAVCVALASPLLYVTGQENGGFHLIGNSSTGKSTALKVACSVYGSPEYLKTWRATDNGLEGIASNRNDTLLILDELREFADSGKIGGVVYMLGNGAGKTRSTRNGDARNSKKWRTLFLSSGEEDLADLMNKEKTAPKAGQEIRFLTIPAQAKDAKHGLFENLHDKADGKELSEYLTGTARVYYGTPARAFINAIIKDGINNIKQQYKEFLTRSEKDYLPQNASNQVKRAFNRFAVAAFAGEYAIANSLTGWQKGEAVAACMQCFNDWIDWRGGLDNQETKAILNQVKAFFEENDSSQFEKLGINGEQKIINMAGYKENTENGVKYYVFTTAFKKRICAGFNKREAAQVLFSAGWLDKPKAENKKIKGESKKVYWFNSKMFESE